MRTVHSFSLVHALCKIKALIRYMEYRFFVTDSDLGIILIPADMSAHVLELSREKELSALIWLHDQVLRL